MTNCSTFSQKYKHKVNKKEIKMIKKIFVAMFCLSILFVCSACGQTDMKSLVSRNISEQTSVYFFSNNQNLKVSLSSGQRELNYRYDGVSDEKVDFALITASLDGSDPQVCQVVIDGKQSDVLLEFNYRTGKHVADLQTRLMGDESIQIYYDNQVADLVCQQFSVSAADAIEIACEHLQSFIQPLCDGENFHGECYLRVMDELTGENNGTLWLFSVLSQDGQTRNVIISTSQPVVLADDGKDVI